MPRRLHLICREFEGFERSFTSQAEAFSQSYPDVAVERRFVEISKLYRTMIANEQARTGDADLFLCVTDWLPEAMAKGLLTPLDEFLRADPPEGWPDAWAPSMRGLQTGPDGKVYGLAYHDGPEVFMYRSDLFGDPREQARFAARFGYPLHPPETWEQFLDVARFFTRPDDGLWGTCVAAYPDGHNNVYDFLIQLWTRGGDLFDARWRPRFHDRFGQAALQFYVDLFQRDRVVSPECLELDSVKCGFYYASGRAAMMWNWCGFAAVAELPRLSRIAGKNVCLPVPRGENPEGRHTSLNIYWVLTIPIGSAQPADAYRFIKHVASPAMDKVTSLAGGNGTRLSTWRDPEVRARYPYYEIIEEVHRDVHSPPAIPEYPAINDVLNRMVDAAVKGRTTVDGALKEAAAAAAAILERAGYDRKGGSKRGC